MTDTPMTPEQALAVVKEAKGWKVFPNALYRRVVDALLHEHERAEALAARVAELEPDARRWRKWRTQHPECLGGHPVVDAEGRETGETQYEWATPEWMDEAADRLAAQKGATSGATGFHGASL